MNNAVMSGVENCFDGAVKGPVVFSFRTQDGMLYFGAVTGESTTYDAGQDGGFSIRPGSALVNDEERTAYVGFNPETHRLIVLDEDKEPVCRSARITTESSFSLL